MTGIQRKMQRLPIKSSIDLIVCFVLFTLCYVPFITFTNLEAMDDDKQKGSKYQITLIAGDFTVSG